MKQHLLASLGLTAGLLALALGARAEPRQAAADPQKVAEAAFIYGYPLVLMDLTRDAMLSAPRAEPNRFAHSASLATSADRAFVRPNVDTLYSNAWLDLAQEPVVLHVPATDRYYVMQMMDGFTNVFAAPGPRTTGNARQDFAIVGPGFKGELPKEMKRIDAPTNMVWILGRLQVDGPQDVSAAAAVQAAFSLRPISEDPPHVAVAGPTAPLGAQGPTPPALIQSMDSDTFFQRLAVLLKANPPAKRDGKTVASFTKIGLEPGEPFVLAEAQRAAVEQGLANGKQQVAQATTHLVKPVHGWQVLRHGVGAYGTDYERRAAVALYGLGANLPQDAVYPGAHLDAQNQALTGQKRYALHFNKDKLPPVKAFWSLTLYDSDGYLVANELGRYAIRDRDKLLYNSDGSLDLLIQHEEPSAERKSNWLPAPEGPFSLLLRLYQPKPAVLDGSWTPPPLQPSANPERPAASR